MYIRILSDNDYKELIPYFLSFIIALEPYSTFTILLLCIHFFLNTFKTKYNLGRSNEFLETQKQLFYFECLAGKAPTQ